GDFRFLQSGCGQREPGKAGCDRRPTCTPSDRIRMAVELLHAHGASSRTSRSLLASERNQAADVRVLNSCRAGAIVYWDLNPGILFEDGCKPVPLGRNVLIVPEPRITT